MSYQTKYINILGQIISNHKISIHMLSCPAQHVEFKGIKVKLGHKVHTCMSTLKFKFAYMEYRTPIFSKFTPALNEVQNLFGVYLFGLQCI